MKNFQFHNLSYILFIIFGAMYMSPVENPNTETGKLLSENVVNSELLNESSDDASCSITFGNKSWSSVIVQVSSRGKYSNCADAPIKKTFTLSRGEELTVDGLNDFCYRAKLPGSKKYSQFTGSSCMLREGEIVYVRSAGSSF